MKSVFFALLLALPSAFGEGLLCAKSQGRRVVSLMPSYTEILFELGAGNQLVGVSNFCNFPPETEKIAKTGDLFHPNMEKIFSLKPDVIFAGRWQSSPIVANLRRLGLYVVEIPEPKSVDDIYKAIYTIGVETGRKKEAKSLVRKMKARVNSISAPGDKIKFRPRVYIEVDQPFWTAGGQSFISDVVYKSGGLNIFSDISRPYAQVSWESVVEKNPDVIISFSASALEITKRPAAQKITAVIRNAIVDWLDRDAISRPSPRIVESMEKLKKSMGH